MRRTENIDKYRPTVAYMQPPVNGGIERTSTREGQNPQVVSRLQCKENQP